MTNPQNQVIWQNPPLTEPFGSGAPDEDPDNDGQTFTLNLRFPGQYFDQETNSNYNYYRDHYFPGLGRYGQSDPIGLYEGVNTYAYVNSSPLRLLDPLGLETCGSGASDYIAPDNPFGFPFSGCCQAHDNCYGECNGPSKEACDVKFCACMKQVCARYSLPYLRRRCDASENLYCQMVVEKGQKPFNEARANCPKCPKE